MTATEVLADLQQRGAIFALDGDELCCRAPAGVLTDADRVSIQTHKRALMARLFPPPIIEPGVIHMPADDRGLQPGSLDRAQMDDAARILRALRDRGVLVTASRHELMLIISRPAPPALIDRLRPHAGLLRVYLSCPHCGLRHSLSPPYGWCWPCASATWDRTGDRTAVSHREAAPAPVAQTQPSDTRAGDDDVERSPAVVARRRA